MAIRMQNGRMPDSFTTLGCDVNLRSMQVQKLSDICVGSLTTW